MGDLSQQAERNVDYETVAFDPPAAAQIKSCWDAFQNTLPRNGSLEGHSRPLVSRDVATPSPQAAVSCGYCWAHGFAQHCSNELFCPEISAARDELAALRQTA